MYVQAFSLWNNRRTEQQWLKDFFRHECRTITTVECAEFHNCREDPEEWPFFTSGVLNHIVEELRPPSLQSVHVTIPDVDVARAHEAVQSAMNLFTLGSISWVKINFAVEMSVDDIRGMVDDTNERLSRKIVLASRSEREVKLSDGALLVISL